MKIGRILKYLAGAVVVLIVAGVIVLAAVDFNDYKPEFQAQVKQATGRDLTIEGDIKLALSLTPSLGVSGVRFANAEWGSRPAMATVDRFEVQVALIPLMSSTIDIQHVLLKGADILLETHADGRANYQFETAGSEKAEDSAAPTIPVLRKVSIEDARVAYRDGASDKVFAVGVGSLALSAGGVDDAIEMTLAAAFNDNPIVATGTLGSRNDLLAAGKFLTDMAITDLLEGRFNAKLDLKGEGKSVRALMAGLNGRTQLAMGEGKMKSTALDTFVGGPTKMLAGLFSSKQSEFTKINCMVSQFDIKDGLATSKALLFDTEFVSISGKGMVNLSSEALDLTVDPQPKSATLNTAVPVEITGTLAAPSFSPSTAATARKVGGLLGAFVFPPALIIGLAETGTGEDNPCLKGGKAKPAAQQVSPDAQQAAPEKAEETNPVAQPLKSIEKGVGGVLKKLFGN